jgi:hypothetical protein
VRGAAKVAVLVVALTGIEAAPAGEGAWRYALRLQNRTCGTLDMTLNSDQVACKDLSAGCKFQAPYRQSRAMTIVLRSRVETLDVAVGGSCTGDSPARLVGGCTLPLNRLFPYEGFNVEMDEVAPLFPYPDWNGPVVVLDRETPGGVTPVEIDFQIGECVKDGGVETCQVFCRAP